MGGGSRAWEWCGVGGVGGGPTHGFGVDRCDEASVMELICLSQHSKAGFQEACQSDPGCYREGEEGDRGADG